MKTKDKGYTKRMRAVLDTILSKPAGYNNGVATDENLYRLLGFPPLTGDAKANNTHIRYTTTRLYHYCKEHHPIYRGIVSRNRMLYVPSEADDLAQHHDYRLRHINTRSIMATDMVNIDKEVIPMVDRNLFMAERMQNLSTVLRQIKKYAGDKL